MVAKKDIHKRKSIETRVDTIQTNIHQIKHFLEEDVEEINPNKIDMFLANIEYHAMVGRDITKG